MNFNQLDFDFSSKSDFKATETQFKPEPIDLFNKCNQFCTYALSLTVLIDLLTYLKCQNRITFKSVHN